MQGEGGNDGHSLQDFRGSHQHFTIFFSVSCNKLAANYSKRIFLLLRAEFFDENKVHRIALFVFMIG